MITLCDYLKMEHENTKGKGKGETEILLPAVRAISGFVAYTGICLMNTHKVSVVLSCMTYMFQCNHT